MPDLFQFIRNDQLPADVLTRLRELQPATLPHREVLVRRLCLPRTFTRKLYDIAATGLDSPPPFDAPATAEPAPATFAGLTEVEPVTGFPGRYSIGDATRSKMLAELVTHPDRRFAQEFLDAMGATDEIEVLDRVQLAFWADQDAACSTLEAQFNDADRRHDISRCSTLVQLAAGAIRYVGNPISYRRVRELQARVGARNVFFAEFFQTESYYPRQTIEKQLTDFLAAKDSPQWIFHVHATGGMGKTTTLRRLLSHKWILGDDRIPCAWLDFDYLDVDAVLQAPALLTLPMTAQWNEQLAEPVFGSFLEPTMQPIASVLFRARSDGAASGLSNPVTEQVSRAQYRASHSNPMRCGVLEGVAAPPSLEERNNRLNSARYLRTLWDDKLPASIGQMPAGRPLLLILDTLEEASLQRGKELFAVLDLIGGLREKVRRTSSVDLRLILSGRYELGRADHVPDFAGRFEGQYSVEEMTGLDDTEARDFLKPRLPDRQQRLIPAMVAKSLGIPFNLSLFAEWAAADPELDDETIRTSEDISTVMLIERIIKRIPEQPLRWIIRYGAVPRTLNLAFLRDVMRQPLEEALSGKAQAEGKDRPRQDEWSLEPGFQFDAEKLWRDCVLIYAAQKGWMIPGEGQTPSVGFRADIRNPMRRLLRSQLVCGDLHRRARSWFYEAAVAAKTPDARAEARIEHIYHSLQLRSYEMEQQGARPEPPPGITGALRDLFDDAAVKADASLRRAIAGQLLGEDFADFTGPEKGYVEYRMAEAMAAANNYSYRSTSALAHLSRAFELAGAQSGEVLPPFAHDWRRVIDGTTLSAFLQRLSEVPADDAVQLALLIAEMGGSRTLVSADVLESALSIWPGIERPTVSLGVVQATLARDYANRQVDPDPEKAIPLFQAAAKDFEKRGDRARYTDMLRQAARVELSLGRITRAENVLLPCKLSERRTAAVDLQLARIELAKGQAGQALEYLGHALELGPSDAQALEAQLLRGEALSQRAMWQEASQAWQDAMRGAERSSNSNAAVRASLGRIRLEYWWMRRLDPPSTVVDSQIRHWANPSQTDELDVWELYLQPDVARAQRRAAGSLGGSSPHGRVRLILMLAQVLPNLPMELWDTLLDQAGRIPVSARVMALMEPVLLGAPPAIPEKYRRAIADALRGAPEGPEEAAWHAVRYGELLAWLGFHDGAEALLRSSIGRPGPAALSPWQRVTYRERRRIEQRMRDWGAKVAPEPDPAEFWWEIWQHTPFRGAAATIENARRAADAGDRKTVERALKLAMPELQLAPFRTAFHAMAEALATPFMQDASAVAPGVSQTRVEVPGPERLEPEPHGAEYAILAMRPQAGRLAIRISGGPDEDNLISSDGQALEIMLRARGIPRRLIGVRLDELTYELRAILEQSKVDLSQGRKLCLRSPLGPLSAAPWELGTPEGGAMLWRSPSGWLQDSGRGLRESLRLSLHNAPAAAGPPSLTMIMPMSPQDRESPEAGLYAQLGRGSAAVGFVPEFAPGQGPIGLLYIVACFAEPSTLIEPVIAGTETNATTLALLLQRTGSRPTVVLDVPAVRTEGDHLHQLLLRNYFAQILLDSGAVSCVIATGLLRGAPMQRVHHLLVGEGAHLRDWTQARIFDEIRGFAAAEKQPAAPALFTSLPEFPWLPGAVPGVVA